MSSQYTYDNSEFAPRTAFDTQGLRLHTPALLGDMVFDRQRGPVEDCLGSSRKALAIFTNNESCTLLHVTQSILGCSQHLYCVQNDSPEAACGSALAASYRHNQRPETELVVPDSRKQVMAIIGSPPRFMTISSHGSPSVMSEVSLQLRWWLARFPLLDSSFYFDNNSSLWDLQGWLCLSPLLIATAA